MKKQMILTQASLLVVMAVFGIGCAKEMKASDPSGASNPADVTPLTPTETEHTIDTSDTARGSEWTQGAITKLVNIDETMFRLYREAGPTDYIANNPTDLRVSVKLQDAGNNQWVGKVLLSYYDNGVYRTGRFITENATVPSGVSNGHKGKNFGVYNKWFQYLDPANPRQVFHGFFEEAKDANGRMYGAVMLIIDNSANSGDGGGAQVLSGHVWVKNFEEVPAMPGQIPCWFVEMGPYDCRTFLTPSNGLQTTSALYPTQSYAYSKNEPWNPNEAARGWRRLGSFQDLSYSKAFGQ